MRGRTPRSVRARRETNAPGCRHQCAPTAQQPPQRLLSVALPAAQAVSGLLQGGVLQLCAVREPLLALPEPMQGLLYYQASLSVCLLYFRWPVGGWDNSPVRPIAARLGCMLQLAPTCVTHQVDFQWRPQHVTNPVCTVVSSKDDTQAFHQRSRLCRCRHNRSVSAVSRVMLPRALRAVHVPGPSYSCSRLLHVVRGLPGALCTCASPDRVGPTPATKTPVMQRPAHSKSSTLPASKCREPARLCPSYLRRQPTDRVRDESDMTTHAFGTLCRTDRRHACNASLPV